MKKNYTILAVCENISSEKLNKSVKVLNDNFNEIDEILEKVSVDPPDYLVNRTIKVIQEM